MHEDAEFGPSARPGDETGAGPPDAARTSESFAAKRIPGHFLLLVAATYLLIVLGALVRANDAGLACPDWPLCFGNFIPQMNIKVAFEWSHRTLAGSIVLTFVLLVVRVLRCPPVAPAVRGLLALAAGLLTLQVLLGALTVWLRLASWTVTAHLITGNSFAVTALLISRTLRDTTTGRAARAPAPAIVRLAIFATAALLFMQMVLGGVVASTYAGLACPEWPTCNGGQWIPTWKGSVGVHVIHRLNGYALFAAIAATAWMCRREGRLARITVWALAFAVSEIVVGIANVRSGIPPEITGLHSALATALVLTVALAVRDLFTRRSVGPGTE